ncbi:MAG: hypothetical protein ACRECI_02440, partial [Methyloceanibacter sp.]
MRYPKTTLIAAASSLALFAAIALPANATPSFAPSNAPSSGLLELVRGGGGGGHMGGGGGGGPHFGNMGSGARFAAIGGNGGMGMHSTPHMGNSFAHMSGGHGARIARGGDFNDHVARSGNFNAGRHERFANNGNWNWNGNRHDHDHHHHFNRFYAYPYFYGGYYAYN